jgi:all-trans-retinol 13,14-reductase
MRPGYCKRLAQLEETLSAFMVFGGCRGFKPAAQPQHMIGTPDLETNGFGENQPLGNRTVFLNVEPQTSLEGCGYKFSAICPASFQEVVRWADTTPATRSEDYRKFKDRVAEQILRQIERYWPELEGQLFVSDLATPLTLRDRCNSPAGSVFGVKHKNDQHTPLPITRAEGLWLAGQAVVAPGIMGAMISAFLACGFILGHKKLMSDLRSCRCGGLS